MYYYRAMVDRSPNLYIKESCLNKYFFVKVHATLVNFEYEENSLCLSYLLKNLFSILADKIDLPVKLPIPLNKG